MILSPLALLAAQTALTVGAIDRMSPQDAGEAILAGQDHAPIVQVVARRPSGMDPRGMFQRHLVERPAVQAEGCVRKRWTATFLQKAGEAESDARLDGTFAATEIAFSGPVGCPKDGYVHLNPGLEPAQAFPALRHLDDVRLRGAKARFTCIDETASRLCYGPKTIRRVLSQLSPWAVTRKDGEMVFWLGEPGQIVTEVRYRPERPEAVTVKRAVPAPF